MDKTQSPHAFCQRTHSFQVVLFASLEALQTLSFEFLWRLHYIGTAD